jgi:hypothetical protein
MISADPELLTLRNLNTLDDYLDALKSAGLAGGAPPDDPDQPR